MTQWGRNSDETSRRKPGFTHDDDLGRTLLPRKALGLKLTTVIVVVVLVGAWLGIGYLGPGRKQSPRPTVGSQTSFASWTEVEMLHDAPLLALQDRGLKLVDVNEPGAPGRVVLNRDMAVNAEVASDGNGHVYASDGEQIFVVDGSGASDVVTALHTMAGGEALPKEAHINWHLSATREGALTFVVLGHASQSYIARRSARGEVRLIPVQFPAGIAVDDVAETVYLPGGDNRSIERVRFDGRDAATWSVTCAAVVDLLALSPARSKLLVSPHALREQSAPAGAQLALVDVQSGVDSTLPVRGSEGVWLDDNTVLYVRNESELWRFTLGDREGTLLFARPSRVDSGASWAVPPVVSSTRRYLAWRYPKLGGKLATLVVDLERREYVVVEKSGTNMSWLE